MSGAFARWSAALALDLVLGEPPARVHPVVLMGRAVAALERVAPTRSAAQLGHGVLVATLPAAAAALAGALALRLRPAPLREPVLVFLLWSSFALRELLAAGARTEEALRHGDMDAMRETLRALVSRPTADLDETQVASAAVESLAENLADSYVAPLLYYALGGLPAALAYRAVNTADAMVGYRGRYEHLGKAAARLDDLLSYVPSRAAALALVLAAPLVGLPGSAAWRVAVRDHGRTASPNAGWPMAAAAGALGVRLEKVRHYVLGDGRAPVPSDVARARDLVAAAALVATVAHALVWARGARAGGQGS